MGTAKYLIVSRGTRPALNSRWADFKYTLKQV